MFGHEKKEYLGVRLPKKKSVSFLKLVLCCVDAVTKKISPKLNSQKLHEFSKIIFPKWSMESGPSEKKLPNGWLNSLKPITEFSFKSSEREWEQVAEDEVVHLFGA